MLFFVIIAVQDTIGGESSVGKNTHSNVVPGSIAVASLISKRKPKNDTSEIEFIARALSAVSLKHQACSIVGVYILAAQLSVPTCRNVGWPGPIVVGGEIADGGPNSAYNWAAEKNKNMERILNIF